MDAKSKADFINSVGAGTAIPCPNCGAVNESDNRFCIACGTEFSAPQRHQADAPAFEQIKEIDSPAQAEEKETLAQAEEKETPAQVLKYVEPSNAFAEGLPEWSIEPPQVMVRRR